MNMLRIQSVNTAEADAADMSTRRDGLAAGPASPGLSRASLASALLVGLGLALSACSPDPHLGSCNDLISDLDYGDFQVSESGFATHPDVDVQWYRCSAGQEFRNRRCQGEALELPLKDAEAYTVDFAKSNPGNWRLPTAKELAAIQESRCRNPSMNPNVFPGIKTGAYWTSTPSRWGSHVGCAVYTTRGHWTCRTWKELERPFLLVRDR